MAVKTKSCCFPHAGGDVSGTQRSLGTSPKFSPRRWGCFESACASFQTASVFPTQVGMFPSFPRMLRSSDSFPHAGGDVSGIASNALGFVEFSPRRWGCFYLADCLLDGEEVFPTQVGMFPVATVKVDLLPEFSPRRWGCFHHAFGV